MEKENILCINDFYPKIEKVDGNVIYTDTDSLKVIEKNEKQETAQKIYDKFLRGSYK